MCLIFTLISFEAFVGRFVTAQRTLQSTRIQCLRACSLSRLNTFCFFRQPGDDNKMLVCDSCDKGYHTYCLQPAMSFIPKNGWCCQVRWMRSWLDRVVNRKTKISAYFLPSVAGGMVRGNVAAETWCFCWSGFVVVLVTSLLVYHLGLPKMHRLWFKVSYNVIAVALQRSGQPAALLYGLFMFFRQTLAVIYVKAVCVCI